MAITAGSLESWEYFASYGDLRNWALLDGVLNSADSTNAANHYNLHAVAEGRSIIFDAWEYLASNVDLINWFGADGITAADGIAAAKHYIQYGVNEAGRVITFDSSAYLAGNSDLVAWLGGDVDTAAQHYITSGRFELAGRSSMTASAATVNEGSSVTFTVSVPGLVNTAYNYVITGIEAADVVGGALAGSVMLGANGQGVVNVQLAADALTEGAQTMTLSVASLAKVVNVTVNDTSLTPAPVVPTYTLAGPASVNEGATANFTLTTTDVAAGSVLAYTIGGTVSSADIVGGAMSGTVTVLANGTAVIPVSLVADGLTEGGETLTVSITGTSATASTPVADTSVTKGQTTSLKDGPELVNGTTEDDVFAADQNTLDVGDTINGGSGDDVLRVTIEFDAGFTFNGFETNDVETISVTSLSNSPVILNLTNVNGPVTIETKWNEKGSLGFRDIQSVNDTNISIIDTKINHYFSYDANAYTAGVDNVDLRLQEIRGAAINFATTDGAFGDSLVEKIIIDSQTLVSPDVENWNEVSSLNVGDKLATVIIKGEGDGDADLKIIAPLDKNITFVDAFALNARLQLDMSDPDSTTAQVTFVGALDDTTITFGSRANRKSITTFANDDVIYAGEGHNTVSSGDGNDSITSGAGNDSIDAGSGNDTISAGEGKNIVKGGAGDDSISTGAGNDTVYGGDDNDSLVDLGGNNTIDMGAGNDTVKIGVAVGNCVRDGMGNNSIDLGAENDTLWMDAKELEVADTITGNAGSDTIVLCNVTGRSNYGYGKVDATGTQRTTSIETFDLRHEGIYLTLTDNLIESAQDKTVTVVTELATGTQVVDITNITTPIYNFTLEGGRFADVVVADEMTVNSMSTLRFDDPAGVNNSTEDTLVVIDGANISATDTLNISGLERIILGDDMQLLDFDFPDAMIGKTWHIDITDALIEQTTGNSTLYIKVGSNVPDGSKLYLNTVGDISANDSVVVLRNSEVTVYLNGDLISADGMALNYAGAGALSILTPLEFTNKGDELVGTSGDDVFYADNVQDIHLNDYANGLTHIDGDKLILRDYVKSTGSVWQALNFAELDNIEILDFQVSYRVRFADAYSVDKFEFNTYYLTPADDVVTNAITNHNFYMKGGADVLTTALGADKVYINGGLDNDVVNMLSSANDGAWIKIVDVERVNGDAGADRVDILAANTEPVYLDLGAGNDTVNGSNNNGDVITVYGDEGIDYVFGDNGADNITAYDVESLSGGYGNDVINARENLPEPASVDTVNGDAGDDVITVDNYDKILGGTGSDTITVKATQNNNGTLWQNPDTIWGDEFNPTVVGGDDAIDVSGNIGQDVIVFGTEKGTNVHGAALFGNAAHPTGYDVSVTSGFDTISGFTGRATSSTVDDILNVGHLLNVNGIRDIDTTDFASAAGNDWSGGSVNNIIVAYNAPSELTDANFSAFSTGANIIRLEQNGEAVLAVTTDADGQNVTSLDLYYVCDTDASLGEAWHVVKIGVVTFDGNGELGLSSGSFEDNIQINSVTL